MDNESSNFRSLTHKKVGEIEREMFTKIRLVMIAELARSLPYMRWAIEWDEQMICEFVDWCIGEYPSWKPEDFILFLKMARHGEFKTKYDHSLDYLTFCYWTKEYAGRVLDQIEIERVGKKKPQTEMNLIDHPKVTAEEVAEADRIYKAMLDKLANKGKEPIAPEYTEHEATIHIRTAENAYRKAMQDYVDRLQIPLNSPLVAVAAKEEFQENNPKKDWINEFIFTNFGYKGQVK